jgi:hypothetical protein
VGGEPCAERAVRMKRIVAVLACALLGLVGGYFAAPIVSMWFVQSTAPDMFGAFTFYLVDSSVGCNCDGQPPTESLNTLTKDLSILQRWQKQNPESELLRQEVGLTQVRLARIEQALGNLHDANEHMQQAQQELTQLGWKDVASGHLVALTQHLGSEYLHPGPKKKAPGALSPDPVTPRQVVGSSSSRAVN